MKAMEPELQRLEDELKSLVPRRLDPVLLDCLAVAMGDETVAEGTEERLRQMRPNRPSAALSEKLAATLERVPFQPEAKTVPFPVAAAVERSGTSRFPWLAAAAAVALAGAWTAVKMSPGASQDTKTPLAVRSEMSVATPALPAAGHFQPASIDSAVRRTEDLGVRYNRQAKPMRVVKVTFLDRMKLLNEQGQVIETTVPRVEYVVLPEQVD